MPSMSLTVGMQCHQRAMATRSASTSCTSSFTGESISRVGRQHGERLAVGRLGHPHRAELLGQVDRLGPLGERRLDAAVDLGVLGQKLQPRAGADAVVGERQHDALGVGVVGDLVAGAFAELLADVGRGGRVGRQAIGHRPVPGVLGRGLRRVVTRPQHRRHAAGADRCGPSFFLRNGHIRRSLPARSSPA